MVLSKDDSLLLALYAPQISYDSAFTLRRIAWALGEPMTTTLDGLISNLANQISLEKTCHACRDNRYDKCPIKNYSSEDPGNLSRILQQ